MKLAVIAATAALLVACNSKEQIPPPVRTSAPAPQQQPQQQQAAPVQPMMATGKVTETMNAAGYTYIHLVNEKGDMWAAVPETNVAKDSTVTLSIQMMAENFESTSLNRKFDRLAFATIDGAPAGKPQMPPGMASAMNAKVDVAKVEQPSGGTSVATLWKDRKSLAGKEVVVRGTVVKFLPQIMGKNWIHLRDGSGSQAAKDNDITVTTTDAVKVGTVVTATGKVSVDKDFGSGYAYPVIVEDAKLK